ncbi:MAG: hypothetical protein ABEJ36_02375 [Candidatus Nanosalina sp.]
MFENLGPNLSLLIKILLIPVLVLAAVLLYRLDRILNAGVRSAEAIEKTAENVEKSSKTVYDVTSLLRAIPFVGKEERDEDE